VTSPRPPSRLHLPSGKAVRVRFPQPDGGTDLPAALRTLRAARISDGASGEPVVADDLALEDAQVLRVLLVQAGVLGEEEVTSACENCGEDVRARPSELVPLGPFADGELDDPDLDQPFDFAGPHAIEPVRAGGRVVREIMLAPRTLGDVASLWEAPSPRGATRALVGALGVRALGSERKAGRPAELLAEPRLMDEVARLWLAAHYPPRLEVFERCAACGARARFFAPAVRELAEPPPLPPAREGFPSADDFERMVREAAPRQFRIARVRGVDLTVVDGVPDVDEGGAPLLGSYTPGSLPEEHGPVRPPEVRIYYRAFRAEWEADPSFDLAAEIDETLRHELEHHVHALAGFDPMDDDERGAIAEEERRAVGSREMRRRAASGAVGDFAEFVRRTWLIWVLIFGALALISHFQR